MELITTHVGADFDALASMLAARRLHPGAGLFFPGSKEESVRRLLASGLLRVEEQRRRDIDPQALRRIVLCDTRQRDRIGVVAEWLVANPAIELVAYDHHPATPNDLAVAGGLIDPGAGATSTLLVELLRERGATLAASEATALLLGVYEDTGSLTYATAGPRDLMAAAWLLGQGADLAAVRRFVMRGLDAARLDVLHRMTQALEVHRVHGHRVGVIALELGEYLDELAPLVSRCIELFELPLLFAIFGEAERVTLIARGEIAGFDLGACLAAFGGGGHRTAASASLKDTTALEVKERLLARLEATLPPAARAADLMIGEFFAVAAPTSVERAKQQLNEWKVNAAPVVQDGKRIVGAVTRQTLDAALQHGLGERPVETVMTSDLEWVAPDAPAEVLGERMLGPHPRVILVGDATTGQAVGLVTRMAVLRHLYGRLEGAADPLARRVRERRGLRLRVATLLAERLPLAVQERLRTVGRVARLHSIPVYLVGGFVRDLLLDRENRDLDLVVVGDGPHFARLLAAEIGGRVRVHEAFLTAVVIDRDGQHFDIATARSEFYRAPAALPEVQTSPLRQDLYRRDFTINTLAIRLGPDEAPELIDYFGGRRDLQDGVLRVLHSLSLIDDPTRVLRAVRLELRLGFHISQETLRLVRVALAEGVFDRLSGSRLREELIEILDQPATAPRGVERLDELHLLPVLHRRLVLDRGVRERLAAAVAALDWYRLEGLARPPVEAWRVLLLALASGLDSTALAELADRLVLAGGNRRLLLGHREQCASAAAVLTRSGSPPHTVAEALAGLSGEEVLWLMAEGGETTRAWVRRYLTELAGLRLQVRGADLLRAGIVPGPQVGRALAATRRARLDGRIGPEAEL
ncbi:MAG: CBS domain-containing protein, partial [Acidobacteriota bacterium]